MHPGALRRSVAGGFTLIELLVVIAIVSLLLAILLPSLAAARDQSQQTKCGGNLRAFGQGFHTYAAENRSYLCSGSFDPEVSNGRDGPVDRVGWVADLVNSKTGFPATQLCPTNPARYNQKLGQYAAGADSYTPAQAQDLVERGYNTNYTQTWYMARSQWNPASGDLNTKRVKSTFGPLKSGRYGLVPDSRVPILGDGRTDTDNLVLNERSVKTMTDGPFDGPYGTQNYADLGPAHGRGTSIFGNKDHNATKALFLFQDGAVRVFIDQDRDGEFKLNGAVIPAEQKDLNEGIVFDGVLSIGRRSAEPFELK